MSAQSWTPPSRALQSGSPVLRGSLYIVGLVLFVGVWQIAAMIFHASSPFADRLFPTWGVILGGSVSDFAVFDLSGNSGYLAALGVLGSNTLVTVVRVVVGLLIGTVAGVLCGLAMAYSRSFNQLVAVPVRIFRSIPLLALVPLFTLWFGGQELGIYLFVAFSVFVMMVVGTLEAAKNVSPGPQRFARTLGASRVQLFREVVMRGMLPELFGTVRVVVALSWSFVLAAEFTGAQSGLGYLLLVAQKFGYVGRVVVITLIFMILALVVDRCLAMIRERFLQWD